MNTRTAEEMNFEKLETELKDLTGLATQMKKNVDDQYTQLKSHFDGVKKDTGDLDEQVKKHTADYAQMVGTLQELQASIEMVKKQIDAPVYQSEKDLNENDRAQAVELQRRAFIAKNGADAGEKFTPDMNNLVNLADYRSAARKMVQYGGLQTKSQILTSMMTEGERKAYEASSLDTAFFSPEILGLTIDCNIECASLLDLYGQINVSRSKFQYMQIVEYGDIGEYGCDVNCDAPLGKDGNIQFLEGKTYDFRGMFCFLKKVLEEANFDFLTFMMQAAARSYRINRNRALIVGDGQQEPEGWLTANCFEKLETPGTFNHQDFRRFLASAPMEYGTVLPIMHQNTFGYLASAVDNNGRFIFGDGVMSYSPETASERIRISNCLPDPTEDNTRGSIDNPFAAGAFIVAAANWDTAYKAVTRKPMQMEQYLGGSTKWCAKYQFGAEDGAFVACCAAGRQLVVGA
jgi:hypothetical protein